MRFEWIDLRIRLGARLTDLKLWFIRAWAMGTHLGKGAYLVGERRRWLEHLGGQVMKLVHDHELNHPQIEKTVRHIERLSRKIDEQQKTIERLRAGESPLQNAITPA